MSESPWIKFYASDWLAGTSGLTAAERGVYITILALIYEANGPIAFDEARLSRRCGIPKASFRRAIEGLCDEGKLSLIDGKLSNRRAEKEISDRADRSQNAASAANKRWKAQDGKSKQNQRPSDASASNPQCENDANQNQNQNQKIERDKSLSVQKPSADRFDEFWNVYPHRGGSKKGKAPTRAKYLAAVKRGVSEETIINGAIRYGGDRQVAQGYAKNPETWINQVGWEDEIEPAQPQLKAIPGGRHDQPAHDSNRLQRIVSAAAAGSSGQDWG